MLIVPPAVKVGRTASGLTSISLPSGSRATMVATDTSVMYVHPVPWPVVILGLRRSGMTMGEIARCVGVSKTTVDRWLNCGSEPRFSDGVVLLALHAKKSPETGCCFTDTCIA